VARSRYDLRVIERRRWLEECLLCGLLLVIALCALHPIFAIDFFWHLELGEIIARTGHIPNTDLFSAADPNRPYVQFNWLWEWSAAELVRAFGLRGIRVAQSVVITLSFAALYGLARRRLGAAAPAFACTALGFVLFEDRFQERPASLALGFSVLSWALATDDSLSRTRRALCVAGLGLLWSNLHGGESVLLPLSLFAVWLGTLLNQKLLGRERSSTGHEFALFGLALFALCVSPSVLPGLKDWSSLIGRQVATGNEEWQPTVTMLRNGLRPSFILIAIAPSLVTILFVVQQWRLVARDGKRALDARAWLLSIGYLILAQQAVRNAFLCVFPLLLVLQQWSALKLSARMRAGIGVAALILACVAAEDALPYAYGGWARIAPIMPLDLAPGAFPELAADFIHEAQLEGGIANDGRFGGYLIWRLWPRCHVLTDSRHDFSAQLWPIFIALHDPLTRISALERSDQSFGTELSVFRGPTFPFGAPPEFRLLFKAGDQEVYQDLRGAHAVQNLQRTRSWLQRHDLPVRADPADLLHVTLAVQLGAAQYLALPMQRLRVRESARDADSPDRALAGGAQLAWGELAYEIGDYADAAIHFEQARRQSPRDPRASYDAALSYFLAGDYAHARSLVRTLLQHRELLDARKLRKLEMLSTRLEASARAER
jgi:hypothetical protein